MHPEEPATPWNPEGIDQVLALLPELEAADFVACTWDQPPSKVVDGRVVHTMPYPTYNHLMERFWSVFAESGGWIHPYNALPEDPTPEPIEFSVMGTHFPLEYFKTATVDQIRRYLALCRRGERFCDGHIASEFECGAFLAALARLKELRTSM